MFNQEVTPKVFYFEKDEHINFMNGLSIDGEITKISVQTNKGRTYSSISGGIGRDRFEIDLREGGDNALIALNGQYSTKSINKL